MADVDIKIHLKQTLTTSIKEWSTSSIIHCIKHLILTVGYKYPVGWWIHELHLPFLFFLPPILILLSIRESPSIFFFFTLAQYKANKERCQKGRRICLFHLNLGLSEQTPYIWPNRPRRDSKAKYTIILVFHSLPPWKTEPNQAVVAPRHIGRSAPLLVVVGVVDEIESGVFLILSPGSWV